MISRIFCHQSKCSAARPSPCFDTIPHIVSGKGVIVTTGLSRALRLGFHIRDMYILPPAWNAFRYVAWGSCLSIDRLSLQSCCCCCLFIFQLNPQAQNVYTSWNESQRRYYSELKPTVANTRVHICTLEAPRTRRSWGGWRYSCCLHAS